MTTTTCRECGKALTDPESREREYGRDCYIKKFGVPPRRSRVGGGRPVVSVPTVRSADDVPLPGLADVKQPDESPAGHEWQWVPDSSLSSSRPKELVPPSEEQQCRFTEHGVRCSNSSAIRMLRGIAWWHYCSQHMYGKRIRDGVIETRVLRRIDPATQAEHNPGTTEESGNPS